MPGTLQCLSCKIQTKSCYCETVGTTILLFYFFSGLNLVTDRNRFLHTETNTAKHIHNFQPDHRYISTLPENALPVTKQIHNVTIHTLCTFLRSMTAGGVGRSMCSVTTLGTLAL